MIKYTIKNHKIEIEYETGLELTLINHFLRIIDKFNEVKGEKRT